jgi:hypothetical protein
VKNHETSTISIIELPNSLLLHLIILFLQLRKALVRLFDKVDGGLLNEGERLSRRIIDIHRKRYQTIKHEK